MTDYKEEYFPSGEEDKIFVRWWVPQQPRGVLVIIHGMKEHGGEVRRICSFFG